MKAIGLGLAAIVLALASMPAALAQNFGPLPDEPLVLVGGDVIAVESTGDTVTIAVVVPDVPAGEVPQVEVRGVEGFSNVSVEPLDAPPTVVLAFDRSGSMTGRRMTVAKEAATTCVGLLSPGARLALVPFSSTVDVAVPPDQDHSLTVDAIASLVADGETATFDAVVAATELGAPTAGSSLSDRASRFVVLVTDGEDTASEATVDDAANALLQTGYQLYALGVDPDGDAFASLETLADESGGLLLTGTADELGGLCASVVSRIDGRYLVTMTAEELPDSLSLGLTFDGIEAIVAVLPEQLHPDRFTPGGGDAGSDEQSDPGSGSAVPVPATPPPAGDDGAQPAPPPPPAPTPTPEPPVRTPLPPLDTTAPEPIAPQSSAQLWVGAGLAIAAPMIAFKTTATRRRLPTGLRIRRLPRVGPVARLTVIAGRLLEHNRRDRIIDRRLELAALSVRAGEFVVFTALAAVLPALGLAVLGMRLSALVVLIGVPVVAWVAVARRGRKRANAFQEQLGDTLMILAGALRSGSSLIQALATAAEKAPAPTSSEFQRVIAETRIGRELTTSLQDLADRMGSDDARWLVEAIALNRELGGNLAATLDNVAETILARAQIKSQVKVMSAEGRLTAAILIGLPFIIAAFLQVVNPGYLTPLFTTGTGNLILAAAMGNMVLGGFWVSRLIKMEY